MNPVTLPFEGIYSIPDVLTRSKPEHPVTILTGLHPLDRDCLWYSIYKRSFHHFALYMERDGSKRPITLWLNLKLQNMKNNKFRRVFICADSSILAWRLPRTEDAGGLQCLGSQGSQRLEAELRAAPGTGGSVVPHNCSSRGDALGALSNHVVKKSQKPERRENLRVSAYLKFSESR